MSQFPTSRGATKTRHDDMKRERDVRLHYGAAFCNIPHVDDLATHVARPSRDSTLTALCQLTAIRMGGQRAMISLIDSERQYILAEATCDLSLRPEAPGNAQNALWLGNVSIPRSLGLGENVLDPNLENNILVIEDLQADGRSCFQGHAQKFLDMRFYAGVALVSPDGTIVGTLSIFDNKPHNGLTSDQIALFKDLASTTVDYLNTYTIRDQYSRGERFTRGLVSFAEGATALLPFQQSEQHDPPIIRRTSLNSSPTTEKEFKPTEESDTMEVDDSVPDNSSFATPGTATPRSTRHRAIRTLQDSILPVDSKSMFSRAANVMMASSDLDGVLILDASVAANGGQRRAHTMSRTTNGTDSPSESYQSRTSSEGESSNSTEGNSRSKSSSSSKTCQLLGVATPKGKENTEYGTMLESDLSRMLREYPHGKIFTFAANGTALSSTDDTSSSPHIPEQLPPRTAYSKRPTRNWSKRCSETIQEMFPKAYSVAFIPFWDFERSRWFAGCLCWSNDPYRLLSPSVDLTYFKIFSNSIMRELSRLDAMTLSQAKSTFVASISHELRSPLHGILGTLEFIKDTPLDSFQASMLNSLHGCGITLLDTINHVMDYAKISESKRSISSKRIKSENTVRISSKPRKSGRRKDPAFDIGIATEEVVEAVFSGSSYIPVTAKRIEEASSNTENELAHYPKRRARFIILEVAQEDDWLFSFPIGSWRRIVMNLFGNAVKYTESGYIYVSLRSGKPTENSNAPSAITLTITDTGLGMSPSFLANRIFEPFCQENPHAPGIGLGLSIVRQILDMSGGKIEVSSQPSIGSKMTVKLALTRPGPSESFTVERKQLESLLPRLQGRKIYILCKKIAGSESAGDADGAQTDEGYLRFTNALANTLENCLKMDVVRTTDWEPHDADLVICPELSFDYLDAIRRRRTRGERAPVVIFIGMDALEAATLRSDVRVTNKESVVEIMTQPCGPYKLAVVLNRCLDRYDHPDENVRPAGMLSPLSRAVSPGAQDSSCPTPPPSSMQSSSGHLAVRPAEHPTKSPVASPTLQPTTSPRQELASDVSHLLIVDDNVLNRRLLVAFMKKNNLQFQEASNGLEALQTYQADPRNFRAILMDMSMPVMDGMTATRAIREHERDNNLPRSCIIALTGLASSSAKLEAWSSGIDHYMTKPVNYKELKELLESEEAQKRESQKGAGTSEART